MAMLAFLLLCPGAFGVLVRPRRRDRLVHPSSGSSRETTRPRSRRSPQTVAMSPFKRERATSSPTTIPIRRSTTESGGIFRRDLVTGALELVADGDLSRRAPDSSRAIPRRTEPQHQRRRPLRRVLDRPAARARGPEPQHRRLRPRHDGRRFVPPGAYELVSARDGGAVPAVVRVNVGSARRSRAAGRSAPTARRSCSRRRTRRTYPPQAARPRLRPSRYS